MNSPKETPSVHTGPEIEKTEWTKGVMSDFFHMYQPKTISGKDMQSDGAYVVYGANGPIGRYSSYNHEESEVTVTCRGATCGTVNVTPPKVWITGNAMIVRPKINGLSKEFTAVALRHMGFEKAITGAAQPQITRTSLDSIPFQFPDVDEQKRIVAKLDEAQAQFERLSNNLDLQVDAIDDFGTAVLNESMTRSPTSEVHSPSSSAAASLTAEPAVSDWPEVRLGDIARIVNGRAYSKEELRDSGKYRVLRVGNFFSNRSWYWSDLELAEDKYCQRGDLLYAWSASFGPRIWEGKKTIFHYHIWNIKENSGVVDRRFLYWWLNWDVARIKAAAGTGSTMMHVTKGSMESRVLGLPPLDEQKRIVAKLDEAQKEQVSLSAKLDERRARVLSLKDTTLAAAFAGDL